MSTGNIIGAVEIGTGKTVAVVGEILKNSSLNIIGIGEATSEGMKKGEVIDMKNATRAVHAALLAAEESAKASLHSVYLAQTGGHLEGSLNEAEVNVTSSKNIVSEEDLEKVILDGKSKQIPENRVYIHHIQNPFKLDGRKVSSPIGMEGKKLEVGYWSIHGELSKVRDPIHIINGYSLRVEDVILSSIASGSMVTDESEKINGVLVVDIGRGTTDYAVYKSGYVVHSGVLQVAGDHITNDISLGLRIDRNIAESLKLEYADCSPIGDEVDKIDVDTEVSGVKRSISRENLNKIVASRVEEIFNVLKLRIEENINLKELLSGVVITGGTSRLLNIEKIVSQTMGLDARLGENPSWACEALRDPEYSTVLGLMYYALKKKESRGSPNPKKEGILTKMAKIFSVS